MLNATLVEYAFELANRAYQFYLVSDVCIKDLTYDELHSPLKELVELLRVVNTTPLAIG
jgi:hypothetical protein